MTYEHMAPTIKKKLLPCNPYLGFSIKLIRLFWESRHLNKNKEVALCFSSRDQDIMHILLEMRCEGEACKSCKYCNAYKMLEFRRSLVLLICDLTMEEYDFNLLCGDIIFCASYSLSFLVSLFYM